MAEKRGASRVSVRLHALYRSGGTLIDGWVDDLSRLGLFLRTDYLDTEGADAIVELELPGQRQPVRLAGRVVRVDTKPGRPGMGIEFSPLAEDARRPLANFMIESSYQALSAHGAGRARAARR